MQTARHRTAAPYFHGLRAANAIPVTRGERAGREWGRLPETRELVPTDPQADTLSGARPAGRRLAFSDGEMDRAIPVAGAVVMLLTLTAGCPAVQPGAPPPVPVIVATQGGTPRPASVAVPQNASSMAPPAAKTPVANAPAAAAPLDLNTLEQSLKDTKAIGFFTKVTLKNQIDDLLDEVRHYHRGKAKRTLVDLRRSFELLMMKVLSLLQDEDQTLASNILSSREAIWGLLADPRSSGPSKLRRGENP